MKLRNLVIGTSIVALLGGAGCRKDPLTEKAKHNLELQAKMSPAEREARRKKALSSYTPAVPTPAIPKAAPVATPTPRVPKIIGRIRSLRPEVDQYGTWMYTLVLNNGRCATHIGKRASYDGRETINQFYVQFDNARLKEWKVAIDGKDAGVGCISVDAAWFHYDP